MKFQDKGNPYFGGGKLSMREWVKKNIEKTRKQYEKGKDGSEEHYGIGETIVYDITLAGGGPSLRIEIDVQSGEVVGGRYVYSWYSIPEIEEIDAEDAEMIANYYGVYYEGGQK